MLNLATPAGDKSIDGTMWFIHHAMICLLTDGSTIIMRASTFNGLDKYFRQHAKSHPMRLCRRKSYDGTWRLTWFDERGRRFESPVTVVADSWYTALMNRKFWDQSLCLPQQK